MSIVIPVLLPFILIIFLLLTGKKVMIQKITGIAGSIILLLNAAYLLHLVLNDGIQVMYAGGWRAPYGIPLVVDVFSAIMLLVTALVAVCTAIYSAFYINNTKHSFRYFVLFFGVLMGVNGAFITGDVFNLYVWIEIMLISSFGMMVLGSGRYQLEGAIKYLALNLVGSLLFLAGIGILYGQTGTLNMAELAQRFAAPDASALMNASAMLFFIAIGIKAALFPFFYWLPASYHTPPIAVTAFFAGLLTKVGVYILIRFFTLFFIQDREFWLQLFLIIAGLTMVVGVFTAASQTEIRRILSFHIISQIGYMIMGLGIFTPLAIAGSIYFIVHNIVAKTNAFLVAGIIHAKMGSFHLENMGNLYGKMPVLAFLFAVPAAALAGIPPLSGFAGKFILVKAGFESGDYIIAAVGLFVGLLTLFSMLKIWNRAFWKKPEYEKVQSTPLSAKAKWMLYSPSIILSLISVLLGIGAGFAMDICMKAADQLLDSSVYINAVLEQNVLIK